MFEAGQRRRLRGSVHPEEANLKPLTNRQKQVLDAIRARIFSTGMAPTRSELAADLGLSAGASVEGHLNALVRRNLIEITPEKQRAIRLVNAGAVPVVDTVYTCPQNEPLLSEERIVDQMPEVMACAYDPYPTYFYILGNNGMTTNGLDRGNIVAVHATDKAEDGAIVLAKLDSEIMCRFYRRIDRRHIELSREIEKGTERELIDVTERDFAIEGIVLGSIMGMSASQISERAKAAQEA